MKIDHIAIYVKDLEKSKDFYVKYFGAQPNKCYHNIKTNLSTYFLSFENDTRLEIMNLPNLSENKNQTISYGITHIAFNVGSKERVTTL